MRRFAGRGAAIAGGGCRVALAALLVLVGVAALAGATNVDARSQRPAPGTGAHRIVLSIGRAAIGRPIPPGFLGLSIEYWAVEAYAGKDPRAINPTLLQLLRNLASGDPMALRIGGVSTDKTWWPVARFRRPPGVNYSLTKSRLAVMKALADAVDARVTMGINLEADSRDLAAAEARAIVAGIGPRVAALELGNEPELYGNRDFGWYVRDGQKVTGRPPTYDMAAFAHDFSTIAAALPPLPLAGPASGAHTWLGQLRWFTAAEPRIRVVTVHRYPLQACYIAPADPKFPTIARLLSPVASRALAGGVAPYLAVAHRRHLAFRIDEMNNVSCGNPPGVPDTFAMALWAIDALFADARVGVDGVNIHTYPGAVYQLFRFKRSNSNWQAFVEPEYYGLLMFSQAAPPGSRLLRTAGGTADVRVWATRDARGSIRVVLINDDTSGAHLVAIHVARARGPGTIERLQAPGAAATGGVTLGGQSFGRSTDTGVLPSQRKASAVGAAAGKYLVRLPRASAALLTFR